MVYEDVVCQLKVRKNTTELDVKSPITEIITNKCHTRLIVRGKMNEDDL
jgi:hypothetical protein